MKRFSTLLLLLATATMISCQKDNSDIPNGGADADKAYVALSISAPLGTRADGDVVDGTPAENKVNEVALLAFDSKYNYLGNYTTGKLTATSTGAPLYKCAVAADATRFFVIVNYKSCSKIEEAMYKMTGVGTTANALYEALTLTKAEIAAMTEDNKFVMVNAGDYDDATSTEIPLVSLADGKLLSKDSLAPTNVKIPVDRIVSKFTCTVVDDLALPHADDYGKVLGVKLHATNTKMYTYSAINTTALTNGADYRKDPNMRLDATTAATELSWLLNTEDEDSFLPVESAEYVLENTCDPSMHNYNNLTQAVIKAEFTPGNLGLEHGDSWFSVEIEGKGDIEMSFTTLVKYYKGELDAALYGNVDDDIRTKLDEQLNYILSFSEDNTIADAAAAKTLKFSDASVTLAALDDVEFGGYRAATAPGYYIKYFQNSINYYDIFIQHDEEQAPLHLGRWGMVRNNSYTMNVKSIKGAGLPYIPSPFDEDIIDPKNPNPENPEEADKDAAYIDAEIIVNGWTIWSQDTDLE